MVTKSHIKDLRLDSLAVEGFRGIKALTVPRLGRVTLFAGVNGVGKTSILEAVQLYASRGHPGVIGNILRDRNEMISVFDEDGDEMAAPNLDTLFYGRLLSPGSLISVGTGRGSQQLTIRVDVGWMESNVYEYESVNLKDVHDDALQVEFAGRSMEIPFSMFLRQSYMRRPRVTRLGARAEEDAQSIIRCEILGPNELDNDELARLWYKVALTIDETRAIEALGLVYGEAISGVAVVGDEDRNIRRGGRRPIVRIRGQDDPVPLRSLGGGATRIFCVAVALANSQNGFLLIDEAENGIHHSIQRDFWKMVIRTATENNVQVLATTHSWDCVVGFAQAASDIEDVEGVLIRLENGDGEIRAIEYSEANLRAAADYGVEVR